MFADQVRASISPSKRRKHDPLDALGTRLSEVILEFMETNLRGRGKHRLYGHAKASAIDNGISKNPFKKLSPVTSAL